MYLFDTDALSHVLKRAPSPAFLARLASVAPDEQHTSAITVGEMVYGAYRSDRRDQLLQALEERVLPNVRVLPFDERAAKTYGRLRAELEQAGTPLSEPDMRIAAIALTNELTLVTGNVRHFSRVPELAIEDWLHEPK